MFLDITIYLFRGYAEGKIAPDEPAVLPPLPLVPKGEKRKPIYGTPQSKRVDYKERDWDRERDRDFELMPPPGSLKKDFASPVELDQPIDPNEPTYCVCHQVKLLIIYIHSSLLIINSFRAMLLNPMISKLISEFAGIFW